MPIVTATTGRCTNSSGDVVAVGAVREVHEATIEIHALRHDVDDRKLGVATVHCGARTADDFDSLNHVDWDVFVERNDSEQVFDDVDPVQGDQRLAFVGPEPSNPHAGDPLYVDSEVVTGNEPQDVDQVTGAGGPDFLGGNHTHDGGLLSDRLGFDRRHRDLDVCQIVQRHFKEVVEIVVFSPGSCCETDTKQRKANEKVAVLHCRDLRWSCSLPAVDLLSVSRDPTPLLVGFESNPTETRQFS